LITDRPALHLDSDSVVSHFGLLADPIWHLDLVMTHALDLDKSLDISSTYMTGLSIDALPLYSPNHCFLSVLNISIIKFWISKHPIKIY